MALLPSDLAMRAPRQASARLLWLWRSMASRLVLLTVVFVAVPVLLYDQFQRADEASQQLLLKSAQRQGELIARALEPELLGVDRTALPSLSSALARYGDDRTRLKLLVRPRVAATGAAALRTGPEPFFYVAAAPSLSTADIDAERRLLLEQGVAGPAGVELCRQLHAGDACSPCRRRRGGAVLHHPDQDQLRLLGAGDQPCDRGLHLLLHRPSLLEHAGGPGRRGDLSGDGGPGAGRACRRLAQPEPLRRSGPPHRRRRGWCPTRKAETPPSPRATPCRNWPGWRRISTGSFPRCATAPSRCAGAAEDNAHAFKTPIAVIRQSVEPLRRALPAENARSQRALTMIEKSLDKLDGLVSFARRMDEAAADLLAPSRRRVDLSSLVERMAGGYTGLLAERRLHMRSRIDAGLVVRASEETLETIVENLVENAVSFSPADSAVSVRLTRNGRWAELVVDDEGPGVDPANLERIFERYFSHREPGRGMPEDESAAHQAGAAHFGIGLWIVRRNIDAFGGRVSAENRPTGGLRMTVMLPLAA
ncbi:sensor histidine kinase KdpD [Azospirillum sp. INR13]|uniref:sensor histidine kinase n=1 Tax=Azospirillum sp. INR13 TaxID=2596919 RepID=UPI002106AE10|nr:HAMP domain-containing sensor histidine kinase [Azospirillum sp. INR13]